MANGNLWCKGLFFPQIVFSPWSIIIESRKHFLKPLKQTIRWCSQLLSNQSTKILSDIGTQVHRHTKSHTHTPSREQNNIPDDNDDFTLSKSETVAMAAAPLIWPSEYSNLTLQASLSASSEPWTNRKYWELSPFTSTSGTAGGRQKERSASRVNPEEEKVFSSIVALLCFWN